MDGPVKSEKPQPNGTEPATAPQEEPVRGDSFRARARRVGRVICEVAFADHYPLSLF